MLWVLQFDVGLPGVAQAGCCISSRIFHLHNISKKTASKFNPFSKAFLQTPTFFSDFFQITFSSQIFFQIFFSDCFFKSDFFHIPNQIFFRN